MLYLLSFYRRGLILNSLIKKYTTDIQALAWDLEESKKLGIE